MDVPRGAPTKAQLDEAHRQKHGFRLSQLHPGAKVRLIGMKFSPQLNGKTATLDKYDNEGRIRIRMENGEMKSIKPENLQVIQASAERLKPQNLIEGYVPHPNEQWKSRYAFLGLMTGGVVVFWALNYCWYLARLSARQKTEKPEDDGAMELWSPGGKDQEAAARSSSTNRSSSARSGTASAEAAALPEGWHATLDEDSGNLYYWREGDPSGSVTWKRPTAA